MSAAVAQNKGIPLHQPAAIAEERYFELFSLPMRP
jgi:hypothetical protein